MIPHLQVIKYEIVNIGEAWSTRPVHVTWYEHAEHGCQDMNIESNIQNHQHTHCHQRLLRCAQRARLERKAGANPPVEGYDHQCPCRQDLGEIQHEGAKTTHLIVGHVMIEWNL